MIQSSLRLTEEGLERRDGAGDGRLHVAIIMDGNGRWAEVRGLPRSEGHRVGSGVVREVVRAAPELGVELLTLFAFSSDNWSRPAREVAVVLELLEEFLRAETPSCVEHGVRLRVIGRRDRLPSSLSSAVEEAERATAGGKRLTLRLAVDYASRDALLAAACGAVELAARHGLEGACDDLVGWLTRDRFARLLGQGESTRPVDLLIRTGGEKRLSDFLLWECAYAELLFLDGMWPDFGASSLESALAEYRQRERRYGGVGAAR